MAFFRRAFQLWPRKKVPSQTEELGSDGPLTAMVITAHPDDAEFLCSGTAAKWCAEGWTVYYVLATSGDKGTHDPGLSAQDLAAIREEEQRAACRVLGVKEVIFLGYPDGFVKADEEFRGQIVKLLRRYRPDVVITWDGFRGGFNHSDHRAVGVGVRDAVYPAVRDHLYYPTDGDNGPEAHQVNELLLVGSSDPDYFIDVSAHMETKVEAILCHRSQLGNRSPEELRKAWEDRMRSARDGAMREAFKWVRIRRPQRQEGSQTPAQGQPQQQHQQTTAKSQG